MAELRPGASRVGFVGLGAMGTPLARHAAERFPLTAYDVDPAVRGRWESRAVDGVEVAGSVAEAARGAAVVVLSLPDSVVVEAVFPELLDALEPGAIVVDMSSSDPTSTRSLYCRAHTAGVGLVDAPVSGGVAGAEAASLTAMVGGQDDDVAAVEPLLACMTGTRVHVGGPGAGHAVKALNNLLSAAGIAIAAEAIEVGSRFGVDAERMIEVFNSSSGRNWATEYKYPTFVLPEEFTSGFRLGLQRKDVDIALALSESCRSRTPLARATATAWAEAEDQLGPAADHTEFARLFERR
jgi:3-hydroxyisobutyrate dehydrogenase